MTGSWKNASGVLESPGNVLEIFVTKTVGTLITCTTKFINTAARLVRVHLNFCTSWGQTQ